MNRPLGHSATWPFGHQVTQKTDKPRFPYNGYFLTPQDHPNYQNLNLLIKDYSILVFLTKSIYHLQIENFFQYFQPQQFMFIDGSKLKSAPAEQLIKIQKFLNLPVFLKEHNFVLNTASGYYCMKNQVKDMWLFSKFFWSTNPSSKRFSLTRNLATKIPTLFLHPTTMVCSECELFAWVKTKAGPTKKI